MRAWAVKTMKLTAKAARNMGIGVVNGFTGSSIWPYLYSFPPVTKEMIAEGYRTFAKAWKPILDVFADNGVKFALEVHPTEIAFDIASAQRALEAIGGHPAFGFNYDPSHGLHPAPSCPARWCPLRRHMQPASLLPLISEAEH